MRTPYGLITLSFTILSACSTPQSSTQPEASARRVIIQTHTPINSQEVPLKAKTFSKAAQCQLIYLRTLGTGAGLWAIDKNCDLQTTQIINNLTQDPSIRYAEEDGVVTLPKPIRAAE